MLFYQYYSKFKKTRARDTARATARAGGDAAEVPRIAASCVILNLKIYGPTVKLSKTKLWTLPPLVLGGIIENQNSDFVKA
jgi:hypothetical protein